MLFRRRILPALRERIWVALWPRRSWARSYRYIAYRVQRLAASPHAIALGFAVGAFISFSPFMGFHIVLASLLAWVLGGSILAAALGTFVGNPLTFPFIWISTYELGGWLLGTRVTAQHLDLSGGLLQSSERILPLLAPMTVGGVPLGLLAGLASYWLVRKAVEAYRSRRQVSRERRAAAAKPAEVAAP